MKDEKRNVEYISIDIIDDPNTPIRTHASEEAVHDLANSIRGVGLIQPLTVRPKGDRFEVVAGHRRLIASRIAGLISIPCFVVDADDTFADVIRLHENLAREDVSIVDQALFLDRIKEKLNVSIGELAQKIRRSETFIRDRLALLAWPKEMFEAVKTNRISFSAAKHLARITDEGERHRLLDAAIRSGVSPRVAYDWFCRWKAGTMPKTSPPPTEVKPDTEEKIEYFTTRCRICGEPIIMGEEEVVYVHRACMEQVEKQAEGK